MSEAEMIAAMQLMCEKLDEMLPSLSAIMNANNRIGTDFRVLNTYENIVKARDDLRKFLHGY